MTAGHVDPTLRPAGPKEARLLAEVVRRGLTLRRVYGDGRAVLLNGPGVHVMAATLAFSKRTT
jgi:hypothetical protein